MGELPIGAGAYLFIDIEDSARLWENHPARMQSAPLARRDGILENAVEQREGYLFETGDAFRAAFATARGPVEAAPPPGRTKGWRRS